MNLSKATKLRDLIFRPGVLGVDWVTVALRTITPGHRDLRQIDIWLSCPTVLCFSSPEFRQKVGEEACRQWPDLDCLLVQTLESRSIRLKVMYQPAKEDEERMRESVGYLLPKMTERGLVEVHCI